VNPITVYDIVIGKIMSGFSQAFFKGIAVAAVIIVLTPVRFSISNLALYLLYIALGCMTFSCIGTMIGTVVDKPANIGKIQAVIIVPLIFMSGIFFPLSSFPKSLIGPIRLLPTTAIFEGAREALLQGTVDTSFLAILAVTAPVSFFLAVWIFDRKIEA
jgi:lipooligosaccharide transport system permease protein